jgi:iron-sulfur cluster assembly protein
MSSNSPFSGSGIVSTPTDWAVGAPPNAEPSASDAKPGADSEEIIAITPEAQIEVKRLLEIEAQAGLRLGIKGGGCSGLSYLLEFTEHRDGDTVVSFAGFDVFLDKKSTIYLRDITLDFQSGLNGRGFVFHNPQASNTCGCGESFSL